MHRPHLALLSRKKQCGRLLRIMRGEGAGGDVLIARREGGEGEGEGGPGC